MTSTADSGPGTLRNAVAQAQTGDTITFDTSLQGQTIKLNSEIQLGQNGVTNLTIGTQNVNVTISGQLSTRIFEVLSNVTINGLTFANGEVSNTDVAGGGAILVDNGAALTLNQNTFTGNQATADVGRPGSSGGAIENLGTLTLNGYTSFANNTATASGGAIANMGTLTTLTINGVTESSERKDTFLCWTCV